jgi:DnaJ-class molecular chaperone
MKNIDLYYQILGLNQGASLEELEKTYQDLLAVFTKYQISHDPQLRLNALKKTKEITVAYEELKSHLLKTHSQNLEVKESFKILHHTKRFRDLKWLTKYF